MKKLSLKFKITMWYTLAMVLVSSIVLLTMNSLSNKIVEKDMSARITKAVEGMSRQVIGRDGRVRPVPEFMFYENGVHMAIYDSESGLIRGHIPFGFENVPEFKNNDVRHTSFNENKYIILDKELKALDKNYWLRGIASVSEESYIIASTFKINIILTAILILLAALGGYLIISRALVPVGKISRTAIEIAESSDLSRRINIGKGKDEISELANTFDNMLEKVEQTFEREKQFTSDASHELRTPVTVILSECEYLTECAKTKEDFYESINSIKRQGERMSTLISELLMISRMDKNTLPINFEETDLSELLNFVCDEQEEIHSSNIKLNRNIDAQMTANVDKSLIARLFINLISNAYQYSKDDGFITVSLKRSREGIVFSVKDTGIGIAKEDLPHIWERFYQVDSSRAHTKSSVGLGLSMVKWITEIHNGKITVNSEPDIGSEFIITL